MKKKLAVESEVPSGFRLGLESTPNFRWQYNFLDMPFLAFMEIHQKYIVEAFRKDAFSD